LHQAGCVLRAALSSRHSPLALGIRLATWWLAPPPSCERFRRGCEAAAASLRQRCMPRPARTRSPLPLAAAATAALVVGILLVTVVLARFGGAGLGSRCGAPLRDEEHRRGDLVLVTGGAGFIGSHLVERLLALGYAVRVLDDLSTGTEANLPSGAELVVGDVQDLDDCRRATEGAVGVFHLAARSRVLPTVFGTPAEQQGALADNLQVNVLGTANVLRAAKEGTTVRRVVYAGSSTVYSAAARRPQLESDPPLPATPYALSKYQGEQLVELYSRLYGLDTLTLRLFMVYGSRQPVEGLYATVNAVFASRARAGLNLTLHGGGWQTRDFVHVDDVARAFVLAMQRPGAGGGQALNIGTGEPHSVREVAAFFAPSAQHAEAPPRAHDLAHTRADTCRARRVIGFRAAVPFAEGMAAFATTGH